MAPNMVMFIGVELLAPLSDHKLEDYLLSAGRYCLFNVLAATVHNNIFQFPYLILFPVAHCDARNSVSFPMSFHRESFPSSNCLFPQHGNISSASQQIDTLCIQNQSTR